MRCNRTKFVKMNLNNKLKIFIVSDNSEFNLLLENKLKSYHYIDVVSFNSNSDCLRNLIKIPDVIFLSNDSKVNEFEVIRKIIQFNNNIKIIILANELNVERAKKALNYGAFNYLIQNDIVDDSIYKVLVNIEKDKLELISIDTSLSSTQKRIKGIFNFIIKMIVYLHKTSNQKGELEKK